MLLTLLILLAIVVTTPIVVLCLECLAALLPARTIAKSATTPRPTIDVLIPAHDEAQVISATLASVMAQLTPADRVSVVADNCSDSTALIARQVGATAFERHDLTRRGKGYALEYGLQQLANDHREVLVIVDADCELAPGTIDALARGAAASGNPVQAAYLMPSPESGTPRDFVSQFAVQVKNYVRLRGLARLGGPSLLTGSGMAFPWAVISLAPLGSPNIVEDMQLGFDLLVTGYPPQFCASAEVTAPLPRLRSAANSQRTRWEHGHLKTLLRQAPRLLFEAVRQRRPQLALAALDLLIPPVSLLVTVWLAALLVALAVGAWTQVWYPAQILSGAGVLLAVAIAAALRFSTAREAWRIVTAVPLYVLSKLPIYLRFVFRPQRAWLRTQRDPGV
ncbi:MAG: glycosyltransferase [Planctomycetaceae bacterium]|nr:glycosyltransferase [Planctomycetaceae bacterium]